MVVAVVAVGGGAGCGSPAVLDVDAAEARIGEEVAATFEVDVGGADCPDEVRVEKGEAFRCRVDVGGQELVVRVVQVDGDGRLDVEPAAAVLVTSRVEDDVAVVLADRFDRDDATVACEGPAVRVAEVGSTFACEAVDGEIRRSVEVRVRDVEGSLTYTLG